MGIAEIIALLAQAASGVRTAIDTYEEIKDTLSEDDRTKVQAHLIVVQAETNRLRPIVDAALAEAAQH